MKTVTAIKPTTNTKLGIGFRRDKKSRIVLYPLSDDEGIFSSHIGALYEESGPLRLIAINDEPVVMKELSEVCNIVETAVGELRLCVKQKETKSNSTRKKYSCSRFVEDVTSTTSPDDNVDCDIREIQTKRIHDSDLDIIDNSEVTDSGATKKKRSKNKKTRPAHLNMDHVEREVEPVSVVIAKAFRATQDTDLGVDFNLKDNVFSLQRVDGIFASSGLLPGMKLISVNGILIEGMAPDNVASILSQVTGEVILETGAIPTANKSVSQQLPNDPKCISPALNSSANVNDMDFVSDIMEKGGIDNEEYSGNMTYPEVSSDLHDKSKSLMEERGIDQEEDTGNNIDAALEDMTYPDCSLDLHDKSKSLMVEGGVDYEGDTGDNNDAVGKDAMYSDVSLESRDIGMSLMTEELRNHAPDSLYAQAKTELNTMQSTADGKQAPVVYQTLQFSNRRTSRNPKFIIVVVFVVVGIAVWVATMVLIPEESPETTRVSNGGSSGPIDTCSGSGQGLSVFKCMWGPMCTDSFTGKRDLPGRYCMCATSGGCNNCCGKNGRCYGTECGNSNCRGSTHLNFFSSKDACMDAGDCCDGGTCTALQVCWGNQL